MSYMQTKFGPMPSHRFMCDAKDCCQMYEVIGNTKSGAVEIATKRGWIIDESGIAFCRKHNKKARTT